MDPLLRNIHLRAFACILAVLAMLSHGLPAAHQARAASAPDLSVYAGLDAALTADLLLICHGSGSTAPDKGTQPAPGASCPLCKILSGSVLAPPALAAYLKAPFEQTSNVRSASSAVPAQPWPQRLPPGRGPPQLS